MPGSNRPISGGTGLQTPGADGAAAGRADAVGPNGEAFESAVEVVETVPDRRQQTPRGGRVRNRVSRPRNRARRPRAGHTLDPRGHRRVLQLEQSVVAVGPPPWPNTASAGGSRGPSVQEPGAPDVPPEVISADSAATEHGSQPAAGPPDRRHRRVRGSVRHVRRRKAPAWKTSGAAPGGRRGRAVGRRRRRGRRTGSAARSSSRTRPRRYLTDVERRVPVRTVTETDGLFSHRSLWFTSRAPATGRREELDAIVSALQESDPWMRRNPREAAEMSAADDGRNLDAWEHALIERPVRGRRRRSTGNQRTGADHDLTLPPPAVHHPARRSPCRQGIADARTQMRGVALRIDPPEAVAADARYFHRTPPTRPPHSG